MESRLKDLRLQKNLTQNDIAQMLGISYQAYAHYEAGRRDPDPSTLKILAEYFEVSVDYILGISDNPSPNQKLPELDGAYFRVAKEAQDVGLPPEDIEHIISLYKKYKVED